MKKLFLTLLVTLFVSVSYAKDIQELVVTTTPPMSCQNCENKIKGNLRFEKGVKNIETNLAEQRVTVTYDADKTDPQKIEGAFEKIGYKATPIGEDGKTVCPESVEPACCQPQGNCCKQEGSCCKKS